MRILPAVIFTWGMDEEVASNSCDSTFHASEPRSNHNAESRICPSHLESVSVFSARIIRRISHDNYKTGQNARLQPKSAYLVPYHIVNMPAQKFGKSFHSSRVPMVLGVMSAEAHDPVA